MASHGQESPCIELSYFLQSFNDTINTTVEVHMSAGQYQLSSSSPIYINYSLVLTGDGDVNVTCMEKDNISTTLRFKENGNISLYGITFKDCNNSFRFDNMDSLTIINCTFREFSSSAVDVFNVLNVQIKSTQFINNSASYINDRHRGSAAGLSISYIYQHSPAANPTVNVDNCTFDNNRVSLPSEDLSEQISEVLNRQYYPARGGALSIIITESYANVTLNVEDCLFTRNYAASFGGGIFFYLDGSQQTTHSIKFIRNDFFNNKCSGGGGAVLLGFFKKFSDDIPTQVLFDGCSFHGNSASSGAGLLSVKVRINGGRDYTVVSNCTFTNNNSTRGSALVFGSLFDTVQSDIDLFTSLVQNCTFTDNASPGGTLIAGFTHVTMRGYNTFTTNTGPTMLVIGCLINIYGNVTFVGNRNTVAGGVALHLSSFAQIKLTNTSHISFINNSGTSVLLI
jgi:predicted outer membrane repeat protein